MLVVVVVFFCVPFSSLLISASLCLFPLCLTLALSSASLPAVNLALLSLSDFKCNTPILPGGVLSHDVSWDLGGTGAHPPPIAAPLAIYWSFQPLSNKSLAPTTHMHRGGHPRGPQRHPGASHAPAATPTRASHNAPMPREPLQGQCLTGRPYPDLTLLS